MKGTGRCGLKARSFAAARQASRKDESLLALLARSSGVAIVERHAGDVGNREALVDAITRVVLIGLEGHVLRWEQDALVAD